MLVHPEPGEAFNGEDIAFFLTRNNLSVELIDTTEKTCFPIEPSSSCRIDALGESTEI